MKKQEKKKRESRKKKPIIKVSRGSEDINIEYGWLTNKELGVLRTGGYFQEDGLLVSSKGCIRCTGVVSTGKRCKNFAVPGELFCAVHGGVSARAKIGKQRLYDAFNSDPRVDAVYKHCSDNSELHGLDEELAILRALLAEVIGRLQEGNIVGVEEIKGVSQIIKEVRGLMKDTVVLKIRNGTLIDAERVRIMITQVAKIVQRYVTDRETMEKIANEIEHIHWPSAIPDAEGFVAKEQVCALPGETEGIHEGDTGTGTD